MSTNGNEDEKRHAATAKREGGLATPCANEEPADAASVHEQRRRRLSDAFGRYIWEGNLAKMRERTPRQ
jgi:hypothetical protein